MSKAKSYANAQQYNSASSQKNASDALKAWLANRFTISNGGTTKVCHDH